MYENQITMRAENNAPMVPWSRVLEKPSVYPPDTHTHAESDVTGLADHFTQVVADSEAHFDRVEANVATKVGAENYQPVAKTSGMTQAVGKDDSGKLWTMPTGTAASGVSSVNGQTGEVVLTAASVGVDMDGIARELDNIEYHASGIRANYELMSTNTWIQGRWNTTDGTWQPGRTDYCSGGRAMVVHPGDVIRVYQVFGEFCRIVNIYYYRQDGSYISYAKQDRGEAWHRLDFTVPENAAWFKISVMHLYQSEMNPSDYAFNVYVNKLLTTTDDDITRIDLGSSKHGGLYMRRPTAADFEQGSYESDSRMSDSSSVLYTKRIRINNHAIRCVAGEVIRYSMKNSQQISLKVFANPPGKSQTALQEYSWYGGDGSFTALYDGYMTLNIRYRNDAVIAPSDFSSEIDFLFFNRYAAMEDITGYGSSPYYGQRIRLDSYKYNVEYLTSVASSGYTPQSCAIYGNELFTMYTGGYFRVYDLVNGTLSDIFQTVSPTPSLHCNSACFGNKQASGDSYPLLYINSYKDSNPKGLCSVQKITKTDSTYAMQQVQTIQIGFTSDVIWTGNTLNPSTYGNGNFLVDTVGNRLIAYTTQGFERTRFFIFNLPNTGTASVTLAKTDILDYFDVAYIANIQDVCLHNGIIYMTSGINWGDYDRILRMYAINLSGRSIVSEIRLEECSDSRMRNEPEGIDYYGGALLVTMVTGNVMRLTF